MKVIVLGKKCKSFIVLLMAKSFSFPVPFPVAGGMYDNVAMFSVQKFLVVVVIPIIIIIISFQLNEINWSLTFSGKDYTFLRMCL